MADFLSIEKVLLPKDLLDRATTFLRKAGLEGYEAVVLFAGSSEGQSYIIRKLYIPFQQSYKTERGLMYHVSGEELSVLDDWLYDNQLSLFCQMHTHPMDAYHSLADDVNCIVTVSGGISIVVPYFAQVEMVPENWAVYRLVPGEGWTEVIEPDSKKLIEIN